ncbi:MAG: D-alanyl-D-alanine dipeptidase, partial [Gammaproteobacteria bacterium]|nr:D-alanyl-D-alanine dipeptidase [Gammaproteobacteria bacterium]
FVSWAADSDDVLQQQRFYPTVPKGELFSQGYIAERSGHSRGSTVDLTLVTIGSQQPQVDPLANRYDCRQPKPLRYPDNSLEMGTGYDCFDALSHTDNEQISERAKQNRQLLRSIMEAAGFSNYPQEWWHYTLDSEPYPDRYFDFPIQ